jgi:hypothetical protein
LPHHDGRDIVDAFGVAAIQLLGKFRVQGRRFTGLLLLVILPAAPAAHRHDDNQQCTEQAVAILFPPRLERVKLFLFL